MSQFPSISDLLKNTAVRAAFAIVVVVLIGSATYYLIESQPPKVAFIAPQRGDITETVTASGQVSPLQNPTLSFEMGGQVTTVHVIAGQKVQAGAFLAALDTRVLSASLSAAEAKLNELEAGPRSVDVAGQQTSVLSAKQNLSNTYTNYPLLLSSTFTSAQSAVTTQVDPLFDFSYLAYPVLATSNVNQSQKVTVDSERTELIQDFSSWQAQLSIATSSPSPAQLQQLTSESLTHLETIRTFLNNLLYVVNNEQLSSAAAHAQQTKDLASVNVALVSINGLISSLNSANQSITSQQLAIQSAQDQFNQASAGATTQDIQVQQAQIAGIQAQIRQQEIIAPFSGTIASVSIKTGDAVSANTPAISLIPNGTFEVDLYLAENDVTKVKTGDMAHVTLDAYGAGRLFPATVGTVESSPSINPHSTGGTSGGYKVTLVFDSADPAIANGMHASATIQSGSAQNVLLVPSSAVITDGTSHYVLKQSPSGILKTPVMTGLEGTSTVEVLSGLSESDKISAVGAQ